MLTIFTTPKPCRGHVGVIQTNAIQSWTLLHPKCEVILFGNEEGTAEMAAHLKLRHIADVEYSDFGTPLVSSIFGIAQEVASFQLMCYANADIILLSDFVPAISKVHLKSFLIIGRRWDLDLNDYVDFNDTFWDERLRAHLKKRGMITRPGAIDYFVFTRGLYNEIPPFAIGRPAWDNWMVYNTRILRVPVIDATTSITAIHQSHDYSHHPMGRAGIFLSNEASQYRKLLGGREYVFQTHHATWVLTSKGMKRALSIDHLYHRMLAIPTLIPYLAFLNHPINLCRVAFDLLKGVATRTLLKLLR